MSKIEFSKRDKKYWGKSLEELQQLDTREFAKLIKSRPRRFIMRNFNVVEDFVKKCREKGNKGKQIKTHDRALVISPAMVGKRIGIYNGKEFIPVDIKEEMMGRRLGEFSLTRKNVKHGAAGVGATKSSSSLSVK